MVSVPTKNSQTEAENPNVPCVVIDDLAGRNRVYGPFPNRKLASIFVEKAVDLKQPFLIREIRFPEMVGGALLAKQIMDALNETKPDVSEEEAEGMVAGLEERMGETFTASSQDEMDAIIARIRAMVNNTEGATPVPVPSVEEALKGLDPVLLATRNLEPKAQYATFKDFVDQHQPDYNECLVIASRVWTEIVTHAEYADNIDPVSDHDTLLQGKLGVWGRMPGLQPTIYSDHFVNPTYQWVTFPVSVYEIPEDLRGVLATAGKLKV